MGLCIDHDDNFRIPEHMSLEVRRESIILTVEGAMAGEQSGQYLRGHYGYIEIDKDDIPGLRAMLDAADDA